MLITDKIRSSNGSGFFNLNFPTINASLNYNQVSNIVEESINISSVSDDATGNFTVTVTNTWLDANYSWPCSFRDDGASTDGSISRGSGNSKTTLNIQLRVRDTASSAFDSPEALVIFHGGLA